MRNDLYLQRVQIRYSQALGLDGMEGVPRSRQAPLALTIPRKKTGLWRVTLKVNGLV